MTSKPFLEPVLALCNDRSTPAATNEIIGSPEDWFPPNEGLGFDFFINWRNERLDRELWVKRPVNERVVGKVTSLSDNDLTEMLRLDWKFRELVLFARANRLTAGALVFDDSQEWASPNAPLIKATWPRDTQAMFGLTIEHVQRVEIEGLIQLKSGGPVRMDKVLTYGTTCLECILSQTDAVWPGDVDFVLCDQRRKPVAILEFKKHTSGAGRRLEEQCLRNYYPGKDSRKYDRLALLSEQLGSRPLPMFVIYYSVVRGCPDVYIEPVGGVPGDLIGGKIEHYRMDVRNTRASVTGLVAQIRKMIGVIQVSPLDSPVPVAE